MNKSDLEKSGKIAIMKQKTFTCYLTAREDKT